MAKRWSKIIQPDGGRRLLVYEKANSSNLYYSVVVDGKKKRESLRTSNRARAVERAKVIAIKLAQEADDDAVVGDVSFRAVKRLYLIHRGPHLSASRLRYMKTVLGLFSAFLEPNGRPYRVEDFTQNTANDYAAARRAGRIRPDDRRSAKSPRDGTIGNELQALSTVFNWALDHKVDGRPLLHRNPVARLKKPSESNPRQPVASPERYEKLLAASSHVDDTGAFRAMLVTAWHTGRRINAICHLKASDILLTPDQILSALADMGEDENSARFWTHAIRWRAEHDKTGRETISPIGPTLARELEAYIKRSARVGDAWLFTMVTDDTRPQTKLQAGYWLSRAEKAAGLPKLRRGGWHAFRRAWAMARKGMSDPDVASAGGWANTRTLKKVYQRADPKTTLDVVLLSETG